MSYQPKIGQIIDGLTVGALMVDQQTGQPYALLVSPIRSANDMDWEGANTWAAELGNGFRLPSRHEAEMLHANNEQLGMAAFEYEWHWLNGQHSANHAWLKHFGGGNQFYGRKDVEHAARAVRRIALAHADPVAWSDVLDERCRQVNSEGWTPEHDDAHENGELASAASCYVLYSHADETSKKLHCPFGWPWDYAWWKPTTPRRDLVKAAALLLAEIERLDRATLSAATEPEGGAA